MGSRMLSQVVLPTKGLATAGLWAFKCYVQTVQPRHKFMTKKQNKTKVRTFSSGVLRPPVALQVLSASKGHQASVSITYKWATLVRLNGRGYLATTRFVMESRNNHRLRDTTIPSCPSGANLHGSSVSTVCHNIRPTGKFRWVRTRERLFVLSYELGEGDCSTTLFGRGLFARSDGLLDAFRTPGWGGSGREGRGGRGNLCSQSRDRTCSDGGAVRRGCGRT